MGWPWKFFLFSLLTLATAIVLYLGLNFGYQNYLNNRLQNLDQSLAQLSQSIPRDQQENLTAFYSQIANLQDILERHVSSTRVFSFLENNTNRLIYYTFLNLKIDERKLSLEGVAVNYDALSQQLQAFKSAPEVESFVLNDSNAAGGRVRFKIFLILDTSIIQ